VLVQFAGNLALAEAKLSETDDEVHRALDALDALDALLLENWWPYPVRGARQNDPATIPTRELDCYGLDGE
jgi:hypothetical protein